MKLLVDRLTAAPSNYHFEGSEAWLRQVSGKSRPDGEWDNAFQFELTVRATGLDLHLAGSLDGERQAECSRCAARYRQRLHEEFRLVLEPAGERNPADPEGAAALTRDGVYLSDDLELGWYRGKEIVIDSYLAEVVALAIPVQPLCRDECAGLCPECGANRNEADCGCSETKPISPFAVLASLRIGQSGGKS